MAARTLLVLLFGCATGGDSDQDQWIVYGILDTQNFLYDQQLVGLPVGPQDVTANCPLGGTVHIYGSTTQADQATVDLTFAMTECANTGEGYDLVFTGDTWMSGSFASTGYKALSTTSDSIEVFGTVASDPPEVDTTCDLAVTDRGEDGEASVVSGEWCGRSVYF